MFRLGLTFICLVTTNILCSAQPYEISGQVRDASTDEPIPFATIIVGSEHKGTSSNINGNFLLRVDTLPCVIAFTHVSYHRYDIIVSEELAGMVVSLDPGEIIMPEVVIEEKERNDWVYNLMLKAYDNTASATRRSQYGKAFYRQTTTNEDDYNELYEIFYDTRFNSSGIIDWAIQEGRYALRSSVVEDHYIYNKNFTLLFRIFSILQPNSEDIVQPVSRMVREQYNLKVRELIKIGDRTMAVVEFTPREEIFTPAMEGEVYVDIESYDVLRMKGRIVNDHIKFISLTHRKGQWKNYVWHFDASYRADSLGDHYLEHIRMQQDFDYFVEDAFKQKVHTEAFLTYYEYYQAEKNKRLGGRLMRLAKSDRDVLDKIGYNAAFWADNPIVQRTPVEEEVIASFETSRSFGSIYLNNREQLILEGNELLEDAFVVSIHDRISKTRLAGRGEKIYLHRDKPFYAAGETIWFKCYLVNAATHLLNSRSGIAYVELIDPENNITIHERVRLDNGTGAGQVTIPRTVHTGVFRLRAYTSMMRNFGEEYFFKEPLEVYNSGEPLPLMATPEEKLDLQFMPEGGHLIAGIPAQMAFKATGVDGAGRAVEGDIYADTGERVADFKAQHKGMGRLIFSPQSGKSYYALVRDDPAEKHYALPEVREEGYSILVNNLKSRSIDVLIKASPKFANSSFYIIGQCRGVVYHQYMGLMNNRAARVEIAKSKLPAGIFQITLFDSDGKPQCERLAFIEPEELPSVDLVTGIGEEMKPREKMELVFTIKDQQGTPMSDACISLAVTDADQVQSLSNHENILTYLLLNSDLRGTVEDPGEYFGEEGVKDFSNLDLVMLTHGWRRFVWDRLLQDDFPEFSHSLEMGTDVSGVAYDGVSGKPAANIYLDMLTTNLAVNHSWRVPTNHAGQWKLEDILLPKSTKALVQGTDQKNQPFKVTVELDSIRPAPVSGRGPGGRAALMLDQSVVRQYMEQDKKRQAIARSYQTPSDILLEEVLVEGKKIRESNPIYGEADFVLELTERDHRYADIFQLIQGRVPGVQVTGNGPNTQITIRGPSTLTGSNTPLFVLDGVILSDVDPSSQLVTTGQGQGQSEDVSEEGGEGTAFSSGDPGSASFSSAVSALMGINPMDVERIEVLKSGATASAFGMRGGNGVIAIYTRVGPGPVKQDPRLGVGLVELPGCLQAREFYVPGYEAIGKSDLQPDVRATLYWNPDVVTDKYGRARMVFYNSDEARSIQIVIQGITAFGQPVYFEQAIGETKIN